MSTGIRARAEAGTTPLPMRQSEPGGLRLVVEPDRVVRRADVAVHEALVYARGNPPGVRPQQILTWTDGVWRVDLAGAPPR